MDASIVDFTGAEIDGLKLELEKHGIEFEERSFVQKAAEGGSWPALLIQASNFAPLAMALYAYFKYRRRRVSISSPKGEIVFENYSPKKIEEILNSTKGVIHIEDRADPES